MRFYEFTPVRYMQTPTVSNAPAEPVTSVRNIPVLPDVVKHQRWQQLKAAEIARNANQVQPTELDLVKAQMMYADKQREVNNELEQQETERKLTSRTRNIKSHIQH